MDEIPDDTEDSRIAEKGEAEFEILVLDNKQLVAVIPDVVPYYWD